MSETSASAVLERQKTIDQDIHSAERSLGIENNYDRLVEASLFIDRKFLNYGIITGVVKKPERIFGDKAWADYLDARVYAKEYGDQDLTPEFVKSLHEKLASRSNPEIGGKIRNVGVIGGSFDEIGQPVALTSAQIAALESNPQLKFKKIVDTEDGAQGHIIYPHSDAADLRKAASEHHTQSLRRRFGSQPNAVEAEDIAPPATIREAVNQDLEAICDWFNTAKKQDQYNPHILGGLLQQRLASLHPFEDLNGTLSRVLMNWSLENDGQTPSALEDPNADIYFDAESWIAKVDEGSNIYKESKKKQEVLQAAGIEELGALFGTGQDQAFYQYIFRHLREAPPLPTNGDKHNHDKYDSFLTAFREEMQNFQEYMGSTTTVHASNGDHEITQGGLITPEFMKIATNTRMSLLPPALREQVFSDIEVYRGGIVDGEVTDAKICQMFIEHTGVGAGYRALQRSHLPATSGNRITGYVVRESLEYYNQMVAKSYFMNKHADIPNPYSDGSTVIHDLAKTVNDHISGNKNIWNSPFASTSLSKGVSKNFAMQFNAEYARNAHHGVLFTTQVPREGTILTHGQKIQGIGANQYLEFERELLLPGALIPSAITAIEIFDKPGFLKLSDGKPAVTAKKVEDEGESMIVIEDRRGVSLVRRTYSYNPETHTYDFTEEEQTQEPGNPPNDTDTGEALFLGNKKESIYTLAGKIMPIYTPSLDENKQTEKSMPYKNYMKDQPESITFYDSALSPKEEKLISNMEPFDEDVLYEILKDKKNNFEEYNSSQMYTIEQKKKFSK